MHKGARALRHGPLFFRFAPTRPQAPQAKKAFRAPFRRKKRGLRHAAAHTAGPRALSRPATRALSRRGRRVPAPAARAMDAALPRPPHGVSVSSALPAQETRLAAPTPARRRTTRPRTTRQRPRRAETPPRAPVSRRGRRVPAPTARAMDAALPRPPHGVSVSSALPAQETRLAAPTPARRRASRPHQPVRGLEGRSPPK